MTSFLQPLTGIVALTMIAILFSENRRVNKIRLIATGVGIQFVFALLLLKVPVIKETVALINQGVLALQKASEAGTSLVFGYLGGAPLPFQESQPGAAYVLAFQALPLALFISAFAALLYHWRILPKIVGIFSWLLDKTLKMNGATSFAVSANIFVGMVEAPLLVRPYLAQLSRSDLFVVMASGMSCIAGTVLVIYAGVLSQIVPDAASHLLISSIVSAPAVIMLARLMVPQSPATAQIAFQSTSAYGSTMDAIATGTGDGVRLVVNIAAMLIVLVALVALANGALALLPNVAEAPLTLQRMLGVPMQPIVWMLGIPWAETSVAGQLLGTKIALNEMIAYLDLAKLPEGALSARSQLIMTYVLCGFANFGSLGIVIGGLGAMAPARRPEIIALGLRSVLIGAMATCMSAAVVAIVLA
jgi:CNT family concentrative nucleoside transporter